jgi:hypothetical protein
VDVAVDDPRRGDEPLRHDPARVRARDEVDGIGDVGVAGSPDAHDAPVLDADVPLEDAEDRIEDEGSADDQVERRVAARAAGHLHRVADRLPESPEGLVARARQVALDLDPEGRVSEPHAVARRRAVEACVQPAVDLEGHPTALGWSCGPSPDDLVRADRHGPADREARRLRRL